MKRSIGIAITAGVFACYALLELCSIVWALEHPDKVQSWSQSAHDAATVAWEIAVFSPLRMLVSALVAHGVWTLQEWARKGALACIAVVVIKQIASFAGRPTVRWKIELIHGTFENCSLIAALIGIAIYLSIPSVKARFLKESREQ